MMENLPNTVVSRVRMSQQSHSGGRRGAVAGAENKGGGAAGCCSCRRRRRALHPSLLRLPLPLHLPVPISGVELVMHPRTPRSRTLVEPIAFTERALGDPGPEILDEMNVRTGGWTRRGREQGRTGLRLQATQRLFVFGASGAQTDGLVAQRALRQLRDGAETVDEWLGRLSLACGRHGQQFVDITHVWLLLALHGCALTEQGADRQVGRGSDGRDGSCGRRR